MFARREGSSPGVYFSVESLLASCLWVPAAGDPEECGMAAFTHLPSYKARLPGPLARPSRLRATWRPWQGQSGSDR